MGEAEPAGQARDSMSLCSSHTHLSYGARQPASRDARRSSSGPGAPAFGWPATGLHPRALRADDTPQGAISTAPPRSRAHGRWHKKPAEIRSARLHASDSYGCRSISRRHIIGLIDLLPQLINPIY